MPKASAGYTREEWKAHKATLGKTTEPIRPQVKAMSGTTMEALASEAPSSTTGPSTEGAATRKPRAPKPDPNADPNMSDPRYVKAIGRFTGFGGGRIVKRSFQIVAEVKHDHTLALDPDESDAVEDYFYILGKKAKVNFFDSWVGMLFLFVILMAELCVPRLMKYTELGEALKKMMEPKKEKMTTALPEMRPAV